MSKKLLLKALKSQNLDSSKKIDFGSLIITETKQRLVKRQKPRKPDGKIHPSMIGTCPRRMFFHMKQIPYSNWKPNSPELQMTFEIGHAIESVILKLWREQNQLITTQKSIPKNNDRVSGSLDAVYHTSLGVYCLVDVKSANDFSFNTQVGSDDPTSYHRKYKYQIATYMMYFDLPVGVLFYVNKNNSEMVSIQITREDPIIQETRSIIDMYNRNFEASIAPDVSTIRPSCSEDSCPWYKTCCEMPEQSCRVEKEVACGSKNT